jgi:protein SCO1
MNATNIAAAPGAAGNAARLGAGLIALGFWLAACASAAQGAAALPGDSVYQARVTLLDQDGRSMPFDRERGRPLLVSMFYTGCPYACPATIETLQHTRDALAPALADTLPVLLVSFDARRDTPERLKAAARAHGVDDPHWTLAHAQAEDVRTLAAVLGIRYRELPEGGFNHATVLILLDREGRIVARSERLGAIDPQFLAAVRATLAAP